MILKPLLRSRLFALPVTFISTISPDGVRNVAPWSCVMPILRPLDLICAASAKKRDTLANIRATGQFVVNMAGADLADKVIVTAKNVPPEVDEFELAGLGAKPSETIEPPGVIGCYAWLECESVNLIEEEKYVLIVGRVLRLEVDDRVLDDKGDLDLSQARPLLMSGRKGGMNYCTAVDLGRTDPFGAMFQDGRDPMAAKYEE
jgi:flavin reductase (DIM6/NTAB) family NADH-FMN oxidoreductase RutF